RARGSSRRASALTGGRATTRAGRASVWGVRSPRRVREMYPSAGARSEQTELPGLDRVEHVRVRDVDAVVARPARGAILGRGDARRGGDLEHPLDREVRERIDAQHVADLLDAALVGDELLARGEV